MAIIVSPASQQAPTITNTTGGVTRTPTGTAPTTTTTQPPATGDALLSSFQFVVGWVLLIVILSFVNKTRLGHVIIYYSLCLMILFILVTEYGQIVPYLNSIQTIGQFNNSKSAS